MLIAARKHETGHHWRPRVLPAEPAAKASTLKQLIADLVAGAVASPPRPFATANAGGSAADKGPSRPPIPTANR